MKDFNVPIQSLIDHIKTATDVDPWAKEMAEELLKEQEAKAIEYHDNPFTGLPVAHCPNCMRFARQFHASVEEETHYCPWCGQAVKWNG